MHTYSCTRDTRLALAAITLGVSGVPCANKYFHIPILTVFMCDATDTVRPLRARKNDGRRGFGKGHAAHTTRKKDSNKRESKVVMQTREHLARWIINNPDAC